MLHEMHKFAFRISLPFPTFSKVFTLFLHETYNLFELEEECWPNAGKCWAQHSLNGSTLASSVTSTV